jgi:type VI secretion system protein ImpL
VVEDHFDALRRLSTQLTQGAANGGNNPMARLFEPLYRQLGLVNGALQAGQVLPEYDAFSRMRSEAARQPEPIRGVMLDLINNGSSMTSKRSSSLISRGAAAPTSVACEQGLVERFPFRRSARTEASVVDVERLFGPQGSMATYFKENLAAHVDTAATPWRSRSAESGGTPLVNGDVIRAYQSADRIRNGMLDDSGRLRVSAVLRFTEMDPQVAEAQVDLGGQTMRYTHGSSSPKRIDWPGQGSQMQIRLSLRTVDGRTDSQQFDGPWALMRFFQAGRLEGGSADRRETLHQLNAGSVRMEWQAVTLPSPIWSDLLSSFRCPR